MDLNDDHLSKRICEIFNVEYNEQQDVSLDDVKEAKEKREKLLQFTQDEDILSHAADCAFDQNGLYDLLDAEKNVLLKDAPFAQIEEYLILHPVL